MIIVNSISTPQEVSFYARDNEAVTVTVNIIDEFKDTVTALTDVSCTYVDGLMTLDLTYDFLNDNFYNIQVYDGVNLIAFHKVYATNQTAYDKYTVLAGYYTEITKVDTGYKVKQAI